MSRPLRIEMEGGWYHECGQRGQVENVDILTPTRGEKSPEPKTVRANLDTYRSGVKK